MLRRICQSRFLRGVPDILKGIAGSSSNAVPIALQCQLDSSAAGIEIGKIPALEHDQVVHKIVKATERRAQIPANPLFVNQLDGFDLFRRDVLKAGIAQLQKVRRTEGRSVNRLERGLLEGAVNRGDSRVDAGIKIAVFVQPNTGAGMKICEDLKITFRIHSIAVASAVVIGKILSRIRIEHTLVLPEIVPIFRPQAEHVAVPYFLA